MKKYSLAAIAATAITLLVCLLMVFTQSASLNQPTSWVYDLNRVQRPLALGVIIPAVCTILAALALTRKISLGMCSLLTLINLSLFGGSIAATGGSFFILSAWFFNMQDLILRIIPIYFAAMTVLGIVEKKPVVWIISAVGLSMNVFLYTVVIWAYGGTPTAANIFNIVTGGSLVLIAALAIYDWLTTGKRIKAFIRGNSTANE